MGMKHTVIGRIDVDNWKEFIMPYGKHKGWTMFQIYVNDFTYISEFLVDIDDEIVKDMAQQAMEHKERVDPWHRGR